MFAIIGFLIVTGAVVGGYLLEHGNLSILFQPTELLIIGGAALGSLVVAAPLKTIKLLVASVIKVFTYKSYTKNDYIEVLLLLNAIFYKIRQQGLVAVESDVDNPEESAIFKQYPGILKKHHTLTFITDTLRTVMTTTIPPHELEALMDNELEAHHEETIMPSDLLSFVADSLPGLGIVAAVLGIVITMGKISEPPEVIGHSVGAALVGTFLGILLSYGYVGPLARNISLLAAEDLQYLTVIKVSLLSFIGSGAAPKVAIEFGRRVAPGDAKPTFTEMEEALRAKK
ncbi:MAG: flagellar motor stator protein MotA [Syntrophales bacterium]|jgi:chemotaxis protein MotA|nr:flagellar motor stator protein MotA [Syntrophales bacterium]